MLTLIQNQHGRKVQEIEEIKGHEKIRFDSINSPFPQSRNSNNTKPKPIKPITQEPLRMEFIDGFVQYLVNNRIENVLVIPTIQSSNSWTCKETLSALGLAWLEFAKPMHHISNPFNSIIHVMGGNDQKAKQIVPGLFIETLSSKNTDLEKLISSLKLSLNSNDSVSSKGTTAKRSAEEHQDQPKRIKFSEFKRKSLTEDGQVSMVSSDNSTSNASKLQKPYLIWDKYLPAPAPSYPSSSLGALLQEPNSVNSRPDFHVSSSVIGIDYGTDWLKVSILKPGGSIETVLNRESKRKTNAILNIRDGVRTYGVEAESLGMRFPQWTYGQLKNLIGKKFTDPSVKEYISATSLEASRDRGTVVFNHDEKDQFTVEELVAMLLKHCRQQAETYGGVKVSGAVITVPPHFSQFERQAILDAGDIANMKIFALIHDETAVAINYAVGKKFPKPEYHLFYDMGAGSTVATLVSFHSGKTATSRNNVDLQIKAYATDATLGGRQIDHRLQNHLASEFASKNKGKLKGDIFQDDRAMARLLKEANRVKTILSANQEVASSIENLKDGLDFKLKVTRDTLESLCKDDFAKSTKTIESVLKMANASLDDVKSLVLFGGSVRVPAIQKAVAELVGEGKIARNVDGDEAAVFGAVLHGASVSAQFKLGQTTTIKDLYPLAIHVTYPSEQASEKAVDLTLYPENSLLGSKKFVKFNRVSDFEYQLYYPSTLSSKKPVPICKVKVTGLTDAIKKYKDQMVEPPTVKTIIQLSDSGLLQFRSKPTAEFSLKVEETKEEPAKDSGFFGGLFGGGKAEEGEKETKEGEKETKEGEETSSESTDGDKTKTPTKKKTAQPPKPKETFVIDANGNKVKPTTVKLSYSVEWLTVPPISEKSKKEMISRIEIMDAADVGRAEREAALNGLETFIYKCKELSYDDDFEDLATPEEQELLKTAASEASEWYDDNSDKALKKDFIAEKNKLFKIAGPIFKRRRELSMRPAALEDFRDGLKQALAAHELIQGKLNDTDVTEKELESFKGSIEAETSWLESQIKAQSELKNNVDPVLIVKDLEERREKLSVLVGKFDLGKRKKAAPKASSSSKDFDDAFDKETAEKLRDPKITKEQMEKLISDSIARQMKKQGSGSSDSKPDDKAKASPEDKKEDSDTEPEGSPSQETSADTEGERDEL